MDERVLDRFRGSIVGGAVGDALGAPVEFVRDADSLLKATGGNLSFPSPALYTDDTQMSICVAEACIDSRGDADLFMDRLCDRFVEWFGKQGEGSPDRRAPGDSCMAGCQNLAAGVPWPEAGVASMGCGAAMRSAPIGIYHRANMLKVIEWARDSSIPTHNDGTAMASAAAAALMVHYAANDVPPGVWAHELRLPLEGVSDTLMESLQTAMRAVADRVEPALALSGEMIGEAWLGHEAVASALYCCLRHQDDFEAAVRCAAYTVGDSDSIACITGAIMGARLGFGAIPEEWAGAVEDAEYLTDLADRLYGASCIIG